MSRNTRRIWAEAKKPRGARTVQPKREINRFLFSSVEPKKSNNMPASPATSANKPSASLTAAMARRAGYLSGGRGGMIEVAGAGSSDRSCSPELAGRGGGASALADGGVTSAACPVDAAGGTLNGCPQVGHFTRSPWTDSGTSPFWPQVGQVADIDILTPRRAELRPSFYC